MSGPFNNAVSMTWIIVSDSGSAIQFDSTECGSFVLASLCGHSTVETSSASGSLPGCLGAHVTANSSVDSISGALSVE